MQYCQEGCNGTLSFIENIGILICFIGLGYSLYLALQCGDEFDYLCWSGILGLIYFFFLDHLSLLPDSISSRHHKQLLFFEAIITFVWAILWLAAAVLMTLLVSSFPSWNNNTDGFCYHNDIHRYHMGFHYPGCYNRILLTSTVFCWLTFLILIIQTVALTTSLLSEQKTILQHDHHQSVSSNTTVTQVQTV